MEAFHAKNPKRGGIRREELGETTETSPVLFDRVLEELKEEKKIEEQEKAIHLAGKGAIISPEDRKLYENVESALQTQGLAPAGETELAESLGQPPERVGTMLQLLIDEGKAVRLNEKIVMHSQAVAQAKEAVLDLFAQQSGFETTMFRDTLGVSRKYAIPLLDYFDTVRLTVRTGSRRTPGKEARENK